MTNSLKARIAAGDQLYGCWLGMAHAGTAELLAHSGYDFLIFDNEHGAASIETAVDAMRACAAGGCPVVVRVPWNDPVYLKRILDAGATNLMIPMLENAQEAASAVSACRYPPHGTRGYAAAAQRCTRWGTDTDYLKNWNDELLIIGQIESKAAAEQSEAIARTDGIDVVLIGINDMGGSIGHLEGGLGHDEVRELSEIAEAGIKAAGKPLASVPSALYSTHGLYSRGYQMVGGAVDSLLLMGAAKTDVTEARMGMLKDYTKT